ncbi:MAG: hypothetical protein J6V08_02760 [Candidatus Methanomethylophilaceae archaeon]|nr:hypothetical protein [Candidatus Methanomethylophilaceae archaeon]
MKEYTMDELRDFCDRAIELGLVGDAYDFIISRPYLSQRKKDDLVDYLVAVCVYKNHEEQETEEQNEENPFLPDYMTQDDDEKDYGPSNPWDAPGMNVSDFIRGVSYF